MKKMQLTTKIFIGLLLGAIIGAMLYPVREVPFVNDYVIGFAFHLMGRIFMNAIKMMVVPLVFFSLIMGTASMKDIKKLGRIGTKTLGFYLTTTAIAITIALGLANIVNPGKGLDLGTVEKSAFAIKESKSFVNVLIDMVPTNPVAAMANGNMLQIIIFAILCGVSLTLMGEKGERLKDICSEINDLVLKLVEIIMLFAPIGVFGLIGKTFATLGYDAMKPLFVYMLTVLAALLIHAIVTYQGLLFAFARYNPITFFKKFAPAISVAFSTSSSGATIPVTMDTLLTRFKVPEDITSFTIPLGATVNMDGTAIMQGVATVFIAQVYGVNLGPADYLAVILTATLASVGTAGVPGVGLIMLSMVLTQVGIPVEGIGLIMGVDRILDMTRTAVNITGDAVCTLIVAKTEGELLPAEELEVA